MTLLNKALTIAGSDTSGGAGMEADLKTMEELGVYGMPALTCIVTMHPKTWEHSVYPLPLDLIEKQLVTAIEGVGINALMGMASMPSSARLIAISSLSSQVSPMPIMPPEQAHMPSVLTFFRVSIFMS